MNRRILLLVSLCFLFSASCASQPKPAPRADYAQEEPEEVAHARPVEQDTQAEPASEAPPATQQGPIDLGLGDDDPNGATIVINRPDNGDTNLDDAEDEETSKTYERMCEEIEHCEGLEELDCEGEMACVEQRCVYTCDPDELDDADDFEGPDDFDGAEDVQ